jgi:hypothetical protein
MYTLRPPVLFFVACLGGWSTTVSPALPGNRAVSFEENLGQHRGVPIGGFTARAAGYYFLAGAQGPAFITPDGRRIQLSLTGVSRWRFPEAVDLLPTRSNYFRGREQGGQVTDVRHFAGLLYRDIYPGIDLYFRGNQRSVEYDFIVEPGADSRQIDVQFQGADRISNGPGGEVIVEAGASRIVQRAPLAFQLDGNQRVPVQAAVRLSGNSVRFELGPFDARKQLIIDPVVEASTLFGSGGDDIITSIAKDGSGNIIAAGYSRNLGTAPFSTVGAFQPAHAGSNDGFVTKISADGKTVLFTTYLGGSGEDEIRGIAVDSAGNAVVVGYTESAAFPVTAGAYQTPRAPAGRWAFITKIGASGANLLFSAILGKDFSSTANAIALDGSGNVFVAGTTSSPTFPTTPGAFQRSLGGTNGSNDAFVAKFDPTGSSLLYSTLFGGYSADSAKAIAVDSLGNAIVAGEIPDLGGLTTPYVLFGTGGRTDGFVIKVNPSGTGIVFTTYLGGSGSDTVNGLALDAANNIFITGTSEGNGFPVTANAVRSQPGTAGRTSAFVTKMNPSATVVVYSTLLGGSYSDTGNAIAVEPDGKAHVTGSAVSDDFNLAGAPLMSQLTVNSGAAFLAFFAPDGALRESTYWYGNNGGRNSTGGFTSGLALAVMSPGVVAVAGHTSSKYFPVTDGAIRPAGDTFQSIDSFISQISYVSSCTFSVSESQIAAPIGGSTRRITVSAPAGCNWIATSAVDWIQINNLGGGQVDIVVAASEQQQRTGAVFVAGTTITVTQASSCVYSVGTPIIAVPPEGAILSVNPTTNAGCPWTPSADVNWLRYTGGVTPPFYGASSLGISVGVNHSQSPRTGTLTFAPGATVRFNQAASTCTYKVSPANLRLSWLGQGQNVQITTQANCAWELEKVTDWISPPPSAFKFVGPDTVALFIADNLGETRTGAALVAGQTVTVTQFAAGTSSDTIPSVLSVPVFPKGSPQNLAFGGRDPNGFSDIARIYFLISDTAEPTAGGCHGYYDRAANSFYLFNDALTIPQGPLAGGTAGTLSNSHCSITGPDSSPDFSQTFDPK